MKLGMDRRAFLGVSLAAGAAAVAPRWINAQTAPAAKLPAQMSAAGATTTIKTTRLYDNVFLLQGAGGNMAVQTGPDGKILIDSSFATATQRLRNALDALGNAPAHALINTHWHFDHTNGNEGMHTAGFTIFASAKTRERLSKPAEIAQLGLSIPASPAGGLPGVTFENSLSFWHNGDQVELVHFDSAHTDTDVYVHFHHADVLHVGDTWFNRIYPFIDESTGGNIDGMIRANQKALEIAGPQTKIIPGHGELGTKAQLQQFHDMLATVRDRVAALKKTGASLPEVVAKKPTADLDAAWGNGFVSPDKFTGFVYRTV